MHNLGKKRKILKVQITFNNNKGNSLTKIIREKNISVHRKRNKTNNV